MAAPTKKRVYFALHAPDAGEVFVAGSFNNWDPAARPLKCDSKGNWRTWMSLPPGEYQYRFVVDDQWIEDPGCQRRSANPYGSHDSVFRV